MYYNLVGPLLSSVLFMDEQAEASGPVPTQYDEDKERSQEKIA